MKGCICSSVALPVVQKRSTLYDVRRLMACKSSVPNATLREKLPQWEAWIHRKLIINTFKNLNKHSIIWLCKLHAILLRPTFLAPLAGSSIRIAECIFNLNPIPTNPQRHKHHKTSFPVICVDPIWNHHRVENSAKPHPSKTTFPGALLQDVVHSCVETRLTEREKRAAAAAARSEQRTNERIY